MRTPILALASVVALSITAIAHETKGKHGGRIVDAGSYHLELVVKGADVSVFVTDSTDNPVPPAGYKGTAILASGGKTHRVVLEPAADKLAGKAETALTPEAKGVVQLTAPGGGTAQGQFK